ncbi:MAG: endonuclease/exonuclease/phosphatase family protein [Magnetococcales bacterium]|nr:endonuclease/exonuclease/phosphatase family protein [Magnetococcales bacterium]
MKLRIATFNLENLQDAPGKRPTLAERIEVMRPLLLRIDADLLCLQEVGAESGPDGARELSALQKLVAGTPYEPFHVHHSRDAQGMAMEERNLVILSRHPFLETAQVLHDLLPAPLYRPVTARPPVDVAQTVGWDRPVLHASIGLPGGEVWHVINMHLKSRIPTPIDGQVRGGKFGVWQSVAGWAEGAFLSDMKRLGQALEVRTLVDRILDRDAGARIVVCGDCNALADEISLEAIIGRIENTDNPVLAGRALIPCENSIPDSLRYSYLHGGRKRLLDHVFISRGSSAFYRRAEIFNEALHDETGLSSSDEKKYPESDHAPFVVEFLLPDVA